MGLYEKDLDFGIELSKARLKVLGLIVAFVLVVVLLYYVSFTVLAPKAIAATLNDNPLSLKEKRYTLVNITVWNVTAENARNVEVKVQAEDSGAIIIGTGEFDTESISLIESGLNRKAEFLVWPKEGIREGDYKINISTVLNGQEFKESLILKIIPE